MGITDVIVRDGTAYLVDNLLLPYWVHQVDVSDPERPVVKWEKEISLVNGHLEVQWLDKEHGDWFFTGMIDS